MTGDVHLEAEVQRRFARRVLSAPMCLAAMDGVVTCGMEDINEAAGHEGVGRTLDLTETVVVPVGRSEQVVLTIGHLVLTESPVRHTMSGGVTSRKQRTPAWRADGAGVGPGEAHTLPRQPFHVRCLVGVVQWRRLRPERHRRVLPPHVINHEQDDIRPLLCLNGSSTRHRRHQQQVLIPQTQVPVHSVDECRQTHTFISFIASRMG